MLRYFILLLMGFTVGRPLYGGVEPDRFTAVNQAFSLDLYKQLARTPGNIVFSPFSIEADFIMVLIGARGDTASEIRDTLHFSSEAHEEDSDYLKLVNAFKFRSPAQAQFLTANALWAQKGYPFRPEFFTAVHEKCGSVVNIIDFNGWPDAFDHNKAKAANAKINSWVADQTHGMIGNLLPGTVPGEAARLILVNADYFKAAWKSKFEIAKTEKAQFWVSSNGPVAAPMMHLTHVFPYFEIPGFQYLELPYSSDDFSMLLFLPRNPNTTETILEKLSAATLKAMSHSATQEQVQLSLPKFEIESSVELTPVLKTLGMKEAFDVDADFSGMAKGIFIDGVYHKAKILVDEEGTEAAAATAIEGQETGISPLPIEFNANHPFLFAIRYNPSGVILFFGRISNPVSRSK